ncbi:hypothetical protein [Marinobacter similis]|uniref:Phage tail collar domain-containing protein n=1 Tax=Marinobacter similis TaxID=1420916 RepID=W5YTA7_9GAMM|nr:hypothetical protein [Marinobacter similis]AHI29713.1 hypothetical protein AU14_17590 [Marinobacter similis]
MTQIDTGTNNFLRPTTPAQLRAAVTDAYYLPVGGTAAAATKLATARTITLDGDVTGSASFDGSSNVTLSASVVATEHNHNTLYYTKAEVDALVAAAGEKPGMIKLWSGSLASIPGGYALCDGTQGTPPLADKFVIGAGGAYAVGDVGGSKDAVVVAHTHGASSNSTGSHSHSGTTASGGTHSHTTAIKVSSSNSALSAVWTTSFGYTSAGGSRVGGVSNDSYTAYYPYTSSGGAHSHTFSTNTTGSHTHTITVDSEGESGIDKNLPPYYALAYIMKL